MRSCSPVRVLAILLVAALSSCDGGTQPFFPPDPPVQLQAAAASHEEVVLTWTAPENEEIEEFRIERAREGGAFQPLATVAGDVFTFRDVGLAPASVYRYRIRACSRGGCSRFTTEVEITTNAPLVITTTSLANGVRGTAYNGGLNASGGTGNVSGGAAQGDYIWTVTGGSLPAGLTLSERGIISGMPTTAQTSSFTARVKSGDRQTASEEFSITVVSESTGQQVVVLTPRLPPALQGAPFEVELTAGGGGGAPYTWTLAGGSLPPGVTLGAGGAFAGSPTATGTFTFTVRVASGGQAGTASFSLQVVAHDPNAYDLTVFEVASVPAAIRPHLAAAVAEWKRVIVGDLEPGQIPQAFFSSTHCGGFGGLINGTSVDDIIIMVDISSIDGPGKILGQAGPCGIRETQLPFAGTLTLDSDDLLSRVGTQNLTDIIFHEIGHILGFGVLWDPLSLMTGGGTADPRFTGTLAQQEFQQLGRSGTVPLENTNGEGTADSHWRETVFRTEVMTGFSEAIGVAQPLSRVTIASMADMGYSVSYAAADPFTLSSAMVAPGTKQESTGWDVVRREPLRVLPMSPGEGGGR